MTNASTARIPGIDLPRLQQWFRQALHHETSSDFEVSLIEGGRSNLTYVVRDEDRSWILRRPPLGHVLATAHDMGREFRVMSALAETPVPVPRMLGLCEDSAVLGAEFYVMEHLDGIPYRTREELEALGPQRARGISEALVDVLVALHKILPDEVGLGGFGRPEGFLSRQVRRWKGQLDASHTRDLPAERRLHALLEARVPKESAVTIIHGDYRLDNVLFDTFDRPAGVIDWEMSTLGDPLTDLALLVVYQRMAEIDPTSKALANACAAPGYLASEAIIERYHSGIARPADNIGFYLGLAAYKLAGILEGIHFRFLRGQTVGSGFDEIGGMVPLVLNIGIDAMEGGS